MADKTGASACFYLNEGLAQATLFTMAVPCDAMHLLRGMLAQQVTLEPIHHDFALLVFHLSAEGEHTRRIARLELGHRESAVQGVADKNGVQKAAALF